MVEGTNRTARIFLSSTFRDFGEERNLLVREVFPALRAKLKDRFVELVDVDLRWGITAEEAERGEVLPICLAEIDRSRPYFIGLLGERYGWVPEKDKYPASLLRERRWIKAHQGGKSVTELEILHGVLNDPAMAGRARFYVRSSVYARRKGGEYLPRDKADRERQQALKARVRQSGFPVVRYATPRDLAKRLERDLWAILDAQFPAETVPDAFEREAIRHEAYAVPRRRLYLGGEGYLRALKALVRRGAPRILITGQSGGGKSALIANALGGLRTPKTQLFQHYLGSGVDAADPVSLVRRLIEHIRRITSSDEQIPSQPQPLFDSISKWLAIASAYAEQHGVRWIFALDALNSVSVHRDLRWFPDFLPARVQFIVSCLPGEVYEALERKGSWRILPIEPLNRRAQKNLLDGYLRRYNKNLPKPLLVRALGHPLAGNPLWLKTLSEELRVFGSHEQLGRRLDTLLGPPRGKVSGEPPTVDDLFEHVLARLESDHGKKIVKEAMSVLWASRAGLRESELLAILKCSPAQWAAIRYGLDEALHETTGRLVFAHDFMRDAVRDRYLLSRVAQRAAHVRLATVFEALPIDERVVEELPFQWQAAEKWRRLEVTLTSLEVFEKMHGHENGADLMRYWLALEAAYDKPILVSRIRQAWARWERSLKGLAKASVMGKLADFLHEAGRSINDEFAEKLLRSALQIVRTESGCEGHLYLELATSLRSILKGRCLFSEAESHARFVCETLERAGEDGQALSAALSNLADLRETVGDYVAAEEYFRRALIIAERVFGHSHAETAARKDGLAGALCALGRLEESKRLYEQALAISERVRGVNHPDTCYRLNNLGVVLLRLDRIAEAEECFKKALRISEDTHGPNHPVTASRLDNLAQSTRDRKLAEQAYRRALKIREEMLGSGHPDTGITMNNLAMLLEASGRLAEAEDLIRRDLQGLIATYGENHPDVGIATGNLGRVIGSAGDATEAARLYKRAWAIHEKSLGAQHEFTLISLLGMAKWSQRCGDLESAIHAFRQSVAVMGDYPKRNVVETMVILAALGECLARVGRHPEADEVFAKELSMLKEVEGGESLGVARLRLRTAKLMLETGCVDSALGHLRAARIVCEALGDAATDELRRISQLEADAAG